MHVQLHQQSDFLTLLYRAGHRRNTSWLYTIVVYLNHKIDKITHQFNTGVNVVFIPVDNCALSMDYYYFGGFSVRFIPIYAFQNI